jgi:hypothetical protein
MCSPSSLRVGPFDSISAVAILGLGSLDSWATAAATEAGVFRRRVSAVARLVHNWQLRQLG